MIESYSPAVKTLTKYVPRKTDAQLALSGISKNYFVPRKKNKILNSRFRPASYFKPTWER